MQLRQPFPHLQLWQLLKNDVVWASRKGLQASGHVHVRSLHFVWQLGYKRIVMMLFSLEARERRQGEKEDSKRTTLAGWLAKSCAMPACLARSCTVYVTALWSLCMSRINLTSLGCCIWHAVAFALTCHILLQIDFLRTRSLCCSKVSAASLGWYCKNV